MRRLLALCLVAGCWEAPKVEYDLVLPPRWTGKYLIDSLSTGPGGLRLYGVA